MQKRYENALNDFLEQVVHEGYASVEKWRLISWYEQERFSVGIRQDIRTRLAELIDIEKGVVFADEAGQIILIREDILLKKDE